MKMAREIADKRSHELMANRAASLDAGALSKPPIRNGDSPTAIASSTIPKSKNKPASNYFRPAHSEIRFGKMRFLVTDRPSDRNVDSYIGDLERYGATTLVRVCEPTYDTEMLKSRGINTFDFEFADGSPPPPAIVSQWLQLCSDVFIVPDSCIAIHCVAGLGRGPLMVVIALIEAGMKCEEAIFLIRSQRRGALNEKQLEFLRLYKPTGRLRKFRYVPISKQRKSCIVM